MEPVNKCISAFVSAIICLCSTTKLFGQNINFYPDEFGSTFQTLSLTNPAYIDLLPSSHIKVGSKNNLGIFNDIRTIYAQGNFIVKQHAINKHWIGADFISEQEGPIIRKNRVRFNYSLQKRLRDELFITLGTHLGLASFDYNGSKSVSQGAGIGPDGSFALLIKYKTWRFGTHINQIFNQAYKPQITTFNFPIYYGYYIDKTWELKSDYEIRVFHLNHLLVNERSLSTLGINFDYKQQMGIGFNYHHSRFLTSTAYLKINSLKGLQLFFSYNTPIQELSESKLNALELGMSISFD